MEQQLSKEWVKLLAELYNISKSEVRRVWKQKGFYIIHQDNWTKIRKGKFNWRKIVWI